MKTSITAFCMLASIATAAPAALSIRQSSVCPDMLYSVPYCCAATDVLSPSEVDCTTLSSTESVQDFRDACAQDGREAKCASVPTEDGGQVLFVDAI